MNRLPPVLAASALLVALAGCSSPAPAPTRTHTTPAVSAGPLTGAVLEKTTAWAECQQLVRRQVKAKADQLVVFTRQVETAAGSGRWTAAGDASFSSHPAWSYSCAFTLHGSRVVSESLRMGVLG